MLKKRQNFYSRMLAAKKAKADKAKRLKIKPVEEVPQEKPDIFSNIPKKEPKRVEVSESVSNISMEPNTTHDAIEQALRHIERQAKGF